MRLLEKITALFPGKPNTQNPAIQFLYLQRYRPKQNLLYVCRPGVKGVSETVYKEVNAKENKSLTIKLPTNFLNVYRWSKAGKTTCGSEWMTQPMTIQAGTGENISFDMTVSATAK